MSNTHTTHDTDAEEEFDAFGERIQPEPGEVSANWAARHAELAEHMAGFGGFVFFLQGLLVGWSLATGEVWHTGDVETSLVIANQCMTEGASLVQGWGCQR